MYACVDKYRKTDRQIDRQTFKELSWMYTLIGIP